MSACAQCHLGLTTAADERLGVHEFHTTSGAGDGWADGNRAACRFFHRGEVDPARPEDHFLAMPECG